MLMKRPPLILALLALQSLGGCASPGSDPGRVLYCSTYGLILKGCDTLDPNAPPLEPADICARSGTKQMIIEFLAVGDDSGPWRTCHVNSRRHPAPIPDAST